MSWREVSVSVTVVMAVMAGSMGCGAVFPRYTAALRRPPVGMTEVGTGGTLGDPPEDVRHVSVLSAELPPSRTDGRSWDSDGEPDLYVVVRRDGEEVFRSSVVQNTRRAAWSNEGANLRAPPSARWRIELWDEDGVIDDPVGSQEFLGIPSAALDGGEWVARLPRNAEVRLRTTAPEPMIGMGVTYEVHEDYLKILSVVSGSPAAQAGLSNGDRIVSIDGHSVQSLGELGSRQGMDRASVREVILWVRHGEDSPREVRVQPGAVYPAS